MSREVSEQDHWIHHVIPPLGAFIALGVLILAPFWAYQWYQQPFLGVFLEPNLVASQISGPDWPAAQAGVHLGDHLLEVNGIPVETAPEVAAALQQAGRSSVTLKYEKQDDSTSVISVTPRPVRLQELMTQFVIPYSAGLIFLVIGLWAYRLGWRQRSARAFLLMTAAASVITSSFLDMNTTHHFLLGWALSLPVFGGALAHLALVFPETPALIERYPLLRYSPWIITLLIAIPVTRDIVSPASAWDYVISWRWAYFYIALAILFFLSSLLMRMFSSQSAVVRQQSRIIIFGALLSFSPILLLYLFPSTMGSTPEFQAAIYIPPLLILPLSVAYAIVRYRLLDVDRALSNVITYALVTVVAIAIFYLLLALLSYLLQAALHPSDPLVLAVYLLLLVTALNPLHKFLQSAIDRIFYRTHQDYGQVLARLSSRLTLTPDLQGNLRLLDREISQALSTERLIFYLYDDARDQFLPYEAGAPNAAPLPAASPLILRLQKASAAEWFPPGKPLDFDLGEDPIHADAARLLEQCQVFAPLRFEGRLIGLIALGSRRSGTPYSSEELEFLTTAASQSSLAVENARLFNNLQRTLNETLEIKNLLDGIFTSIASGILTADQDGNVLLFNKAAEKILGIPAAQVVGRKMPVALDGLWSGLEPIVRAVVEEGKPSATQLLEPELDDRGKLYLRLSSTPLQDARHQVKGVTVLIDDLTELRFLEAERERIRRTFGRVVAPRVRDRLLENSANLHLEGVNGPITVMFADISGFTSLSERTPPEKLLQVLNIYLSTAAQAVLDEEGTLDKFLGDAVMAFWNAPDPQPDHTLRAIRAALEINRRISQVRANLDTSYQLYFSIGIVRGEAMIGNVGTDELFNFTVIGDTVNLAQRLESAAKPGQILLSEETARAVIDAVIARPLPPMRVKGKQQPVNVFVLEGLRQASPGSE